MTEFLVTFRVRLLNAVTFQFLENHERFEKVSDTVNKFSTKIDAPEPHYACNRARVLAENIFEGDYEFSDFEAEPLGDLAPANDTVKPSESATDTKPKRGRRKKAK